GACISLARLRHGGASVRGELREHYTRRFLVVQRSQCREKQRPEPRHQQLTTSLNNHDRYDRRAHLSRVEIHADGLTDRKKAGLAVTKFHCGRDAVLRECHKCDLDGCSYSTQNVSNLHTSYRTCDT